MTNASISTGYTPEIARHVLLAYYGNLVKSGFGDRQGSWRDTQKCQPCDGTGARGYDEKNKRVVTDGKATYEEPTPIPCLVCGGTGRDPTRGFNAASGAPNREADLAPRWKALRGSALALQIVMVPRSFAKMCCMRLDQDGRVDCALAMIDERDWTDKELFGVSEFTIAVKLAVHKLADEGLFDPQPLALGLEEGHRLPLSADDGMTEGFKILSAGVKAAVAYVEANPETVKPVSHEEIYGETWALIPQWLRDHWSKPEGVQL